MLAKQRRSNLPPQRVHKPGVDRANHTYYVDCHTLGVPDADGNRFYTVFVDAFSRYIACFLHGNDNEDTLVYNAKRLLQEMPHDEKVMAFHCDNARVYRDSEKFTSWCRDNEIRLLYSNPYASHQAGLAEAPGWYLESAARAYLLQGGAPDNLFSVALVHAVWVKNRLPHANLPAGVTPYTLHFGHRPSVAHLHPLFSFAAVYQDRNLRRNKAAPSSLRCVYMGAGNAYNTHGALFYALDERRELFSSNYRVAPEHFPWKRFSPDDPRTYKRVDDAPGSDSDEQDEVAGSRVRLPRHTRRAEPDEAWTPEGPSAGAASPSAEGTTQATPALNARPRRTAARPASYALAVQDRVASVAPAVSTFKEPRSVKEILAMPDETRRLWLDAWDAEWQNLTEKQAFEWGFPDDRYHVIDSTAVYKVKVHPDGSFQKLKTRLVCRGDQLSADLETYSPVARLPALRYLLTMVAEQDLFLDGLDVEGAYLLSPLPEDVFVAMRPPRGFEHPDGALMLLKKACYGLQVSGRQWHMTFTQRLNYLGFVCSVNDGCIFVLKSSWEHRLDVPKQLVWTLTLVVYVDDCAVGHDSRTAFDAFIKALKDGGYGVKVESPLRGFLGIRINADRENGRVLIDQEQYIAKMASDLGFTESRPRYTPLETGVRLSSDQCPEKADHADVRFMQKLVGMLLWIVNGTRPDSADAVGLVAQFASNPAKIHLRAALRVAIHLYTTRTLALTYNKCASPRLQFYADASHGDRDGKRSTIGYVALKNGGAVSWQSKALKIVCLSTCESELYALNLAAVEALYFKNVLNDLFPESPDATDATTLYGDNQAANAIAKGTGLSSRTRHINLRECWIRELVAKKSIEVKYISTKSQLADIMTKPLAREQHETLRSYILGHATPRDGGVNAT